MKHAFSRKSLEASAVSGQIRPLRPILVNAKKQLLCSILRRDGIAAFLNYVNSLMEFLAWLSTYIYLKWMNILPTETFLNHCCKRILQILKKKLCSLGIVSFWPRCYFKCTFFSGYILPHWHPSDIHKGYPIFG